MKREITNILEEARRAPSVLNSQPWKFRVCGNTIEVYLEKNPRLVELDPHGRLQLASCGTMIAHLRNTIKKRGWLPKTSYFPRFEEEDLIAFVEVNGVNENKKEKLSDTDTGVPKSETPDSLEAVQEEIAEIAGRKEVGLIVHDDGPDRKVRNYFRDNCGEKIKSEVFKQSLNLFLRSGESDESIPFEDEMLLSDRFFLLEEQSGSDEHQTHSFNNRFLILVTGTDNRYEWTRSGEVLGNIMIQLRNWYNVGLMALPIITDECCRNWIKEELNIAGYPQFVLKMQPVKPREHIRKRPLKDLLKYGF